MKIRLSSEVKAIIVVVSLLAILLTYGVYKKNKVTVLEFGMFTGSYWDVANANSFIIIDEAIHRFEETHPGVKVHYYSGILKEDYSEWFSRKLLEGNEPDVFMVLGTDFNQYASMGVLKNLNSLMETDTSFDKDKYFTSSLKTGQYGSSQYALPYETVPTLMFVNKTLLKKEGIDMPSTDWTWDDMYEICAKATRDIDGDGILDQFGCYNYTWRDAVCAGGVQLFSEDGKSVNLADDAVVESVKFIRKLNGLNKDTKITREHFNGGSVVFMPLTFAEYRTYKTFPYKIRKYANFQWDCLTMPAGANGGNLSRVDTLLMGISNKTKEEKLAWEFLKLLTYDAEIQTDIFRYSQGASVLKEVTGSSAMENIVQQDMEEGDTVISAELLSRVIEEGYVEAQFRKMNQAMALADSGIADILENETTIDSGLKILHRSIENYLEQDNTK